MRAGMIARQSRLIGNYFMTTLLQNSSGWRGLSTAKATQRIPTEIRLRTAEKVRNSLVVTLSQDARGSSVGLSASALHAFITFRQLLTYKRAKPHAQAIEVDFRDGQSFRFPAELLRVESPSADNSRVDVKGNKRIVVYSPQIVSGRRHIGILSLEQVGNYGIRYAFQTPSRHKMFIEPDKMFRFVLRDSSHQS
eukprot:832443-Prorocentrum_minimum.AAC.1